MTFTALLDELRAVANAYPEAYEERPWGELASKVRKKAFAFWFVRDAPEVGEDGSEKRPVLSATMKLTDSHADALALPQVEPSGYGLGKHGWVTARFHDPAEVDVPTLLMWLEESYRRVAPKTLARKVPAGGPVPTSDDPVPDPPADAPVVMVVSDDSLRAARALTGLATREIRGIRTTTADLDTLADADAQVFVVDLGRSASIALALAEQLALLHFDRPLFLAGIRDARAEEAARSALAGASGVVFLRDPPGDPRVLDAVVAQLGSLD